MLPYNLGRRVVIMPNSLPLKAELVQRESKSGNLYMCIEIKLTDSYIKRVFVESSEIELIKLYYNKENK